MLLPRGDATCVTPIYQIRGHNMPKAATSGFQLLIPSLSLSFHLPSSVHVYMHLS